MEKRELSPAELSSLFYRAAEAGADAAFSGMGPHHHYGPTPRGWTRTQHSAFSDRRFVLIPDGTSPEAKFAKKHYGAGGAETPAYSTSIPVTGWGKVGNELFARAFAEVLIGTGIAAMATDWADTDD